MGAERTLGRMMSFRWAFVFVLTQTLWAAGTTVRFEPESPEIGPFPTDALTVPDAAQKTRRRVNLPMPDCTARRSDCLDSTAVNEFDGFSILPRVRVRFSGPIDVNTLRDGIFLLALDNLTDEEYGVHRAATAVPINQVVYDPDTHTAYAKPDNVLDQHRRYALMVTDAVRDRVGDAVGPGPEFLRCIGEPARSEYCGELASLTRMLNAVGGRFGAARRVVALSVFTTMSTSDWMEKARDTLNSTSPMLRIAQPRSAFEIGDIASMVLRQQSRANPMEFLPDFPVPLISLSGVIRVVFGSYWSPTFLDQRQHISVTPTGEFVSVPSASEEIQFHVWVPSSPKPRFGYPVLIAMGGITTHRFETTGIVSVFASEGYAVVQLNAYGHGRGPEGKLLITENNGAVTGLPAGGRGVDVDGNGVFDVIEGFYDVAGSTGARDGQRQTVLDLIQLTRAIRVGIDLDSDGFPDLDPTQIYYIGQSQGAIHGTILSALEPSISAAVLTVPGGPLVDVLRWTTLGFARSLLTASLAARVPAVTNMTTGQQHNYVLRHQPVKVNDIPGAIDVQNVIEMMEWIQVPGDPIAYAPHLRASTLPGVPLRRVLFQHARDDTWIPNPQGSALLRAANMQDWSAQL